MKETAVDVDAPATEVVDPVAEDAASSTEADATATGAGESTAESGNPDTDVDRPTTIDRS